MFTPDELQSLARGARYLAAEAKGDMERHENPVLKDIAQQSREFYLRLADKCERLSKIAVVKK